MKDIVLEYFNYFLLDIKEAQFFMRNLYGDLNYLQAKNQGLIPSRLDEDIKHSRIRRYYFGGRGATFSTKKYSFNVEFDFDSFKIGFSKFNFSCYLSSRLSDIGEKNEIIEDVIRMNLDNCIIKESSGIYVPC